MIRHIETRLNRNGSLLKHSVVILIGSSIANVFNYVYQLLMGRMLGPADYGALGALFSIIYIATFSFGTIRTVVMKFTSDFRNEPGKIKSLLFVSMEKLALYGSLALLFFLLFSSYIADFLNINATSLVILTGIYLLLSLLFPVPLGILNGLEKYMSLNAITILASFLKLVLGVGIVYLGYGVFGAMLTLNVAQLVALVVPFLILIPLLRHKREKISNFEIFDYTIPVFLGITLMNLFVNVDILLVKHYFNPVDAGFYNAASVLGKVILFATSALVIVMFPKVSMNKKSRPQILKSTLFYTAVISAGVVAIYYIMPNFVSRLLFGSSYEISQYVGMFGLALGIFSVNNVLVNYNLAVKKLPFVYYLIPILIVEIAGIVFFHSSIKEVIQVVLVTNIIAMMFMLFVTRKELGYNGTV